METISYCVGQKHYSGSKNIVVEITLNKKTGREIRLLVGQNSIFKKKSRIVSNITTEAEGFGDFFRNLCEKGVIVSKKMAKKRDNVRTQHEPWILQQTLLVLLQPKILKQLYQQYQK